MNTHRIAHWLWRSRTLSARFARGVLLPLAGLHRVVMASRAALYRAGWLKVRRLPLPAVAVGNLSVGGAGKTPLAAWIANSLQSRGLTPGILLRGYGGDEPLVHQQLVPGAVVVADADRVAAAHRAADAGALVLVLDDAYQRLDVARDVNLAVVSAEHAGFVPWPLPAGPWREGWGALARADAVVVTRKRARAEEAAQLAARLADRHPTIPVAVAHLALTRLEGLVTGLRLPLAVLAGKRVVAAAGIADPASFAVQIRASRATVQLLAYQDHHTYGDADLALLVRSAGEADYVVVTEKDAVKLRHRWPANVREPLVAVLTVTWESNADAVTRLLARIP
ncbi:MAG: tetraacyldisaccharide 4'-kinase [Gemmatimonadetes bacterium]|nr:tetraacyldisaccharide 4'-kinase [Gemmatimonadota bacterium]